MKLKVKIDVIVDADYRVTPESIARRVRESVTQLGDTIFVIRDAKVIDVEEVTE